MYQRFHSKSSRVFKVSINKKNKVVYSIGEEGYFKMINLNNCRELFSEKISKKKVTAMVVNHEDYFAAIASLDGNIYIYDIEIEVPRFKQKVTLSKKGARIRGLDFCSKCGILAAACYTTSKIWLYRASMPQSSISKFSLQVIY